MAYNPNKAICPGHAILEALKRENMTQKSLSERTGLTEKHISQIINGEASITIHTSLLLENVFGGSASFWINLEKNYQETKARIERSSLIEDEVRLVKQFPYNQLAKLGYVEITANNNKRVENLWRFFGVNSLLSVESVQPVAYRKNNSKIDEKAIATWLRCGELDFKKVSLPEYSEKKLKESIKDIKSLFLTSSDNYLKELGCILNESGVFFVIIPHFPKMGASGAARWVGNNPIIQLSVFNSWADIFCFNVFHELGHLILHGKKDRFIEFDNLEMSTLTEKEKQADDFARNILIPEKFYTDFTKGSLSKSSIIDFAGLVGVQPGVVAGRLCRDGFVDWKDVSQLRPRLKLINE